MFCPEPYCVCTFKSATTSIYTINGFGYTVATDISNYRATDSVNACPYRALGEAGSRIIVSSRTGNTCGLLHTVDVSQTGVLSPQKPSSISGPLSLLDSYSSILHPSSSPFLASSTLSTSIQATRAATKAPASSSCSLVYYFPSSYQNLSDPHASGLPASVSVVINLRRRSAHWLSVVIRLPHGQTVGLCGRTFTCCEFH